MFREKRDGTLSMDTLTPQCKMWKEMNQLKTPANNNGGNERRCCHGGGVRGVQSKATQNRWTELLLLEGSKMNHTPSAPGSRAIEARGREANGDACWDTGYHRTQAPCCQCLGTKAGGATEGKAPYS